MRCGARDINTCSAVLPACLAWACRVPVLSCPAACARVMSHVKINDVCTSRGCRAFEVPMRISQRHDECVPPALLVMPHVCGANPRYVTGDSDISVESVHCVSVSVIQNSGPIS